MTDHHNTIYSSYRTKVNTHIYELFRLKDLDGFWKEKMLTGGIKTKVDLPRPSNLEPGEVDGLNYHRFAVAYGLSFPEYDIGKIVPPHKIEDLSRNKNIVDIDRFFLGKEVE
ncbi:MAG: hypothetical protein ACE5HO_10225 [bacterium]